MCGINFILDKTGRLPAGLIGTMNESIKHRGMDNTSCYEVRRGDNTIHLGANRLRIIDQDPASDQPMISADGNNALVFSGEIYNHRELRQVLEKKGIKFRTGSDTETLLYHLEKNGVAGLNDLEGMFSFVFFEGHDNRIIAARDRHGIKPLFYTHNPGYLIFSSETRGILSTGIINNELSTEAIDDYLQYRYVRQPKTVYRNILQVSPGSYILVDLNKNSNSTKTYLKPGRIGSYNNDNEIMRSVEDKISLSLEKHLVTGKPAGLMLSGGVDSTLLLSIAREKGLTLPQTFSIINSPDERSFGTLDYRYVKLVREKFGLKDHHEIIVDKNILHELSGLVRELDMPVGDPAFVTTSLLAREANGNAGVLISGAGADEYFGGYNRHKAYEKYLKYKLPFQLAGTLNPVLNRLLYTGRPHAFRKQFRLIKKLTGAIDGNPMVTYDNFMSALPGPETKSGLTGNRKEGPLATKQELMNLAFARDRNEYLVDDVLLMSDQITLYNGIELRTPYLDNNLVEYMQSMDPFLILEHGPKWILREILKNYGLHKIASRPKEGFGLPFGLWIRNEEFNYLRNSITDKKNPLFDYADFNQVSKLVNLHFTNREDHSNTVFSLLTLSEWLKSN